MEASVARVLLDTRLPQLDRLLDFRVPEPLRNQIAQGVRVRVPLRGGRLAAGYVVELAGSTDYAGELEDIERVVSSTVVLHPEVLQLAQDVAERAAGNTADVLRLAIPTRQARVEKSFAVPALPPLEEREPNHPWSAVVPGSRWVADLPGGVAEVGETTVGAWAAQLAELVRETLQRGEQAIIVVPDYRDQRQLHAALANAVGEERIAALDARQSNADRARNFLLAGSGLPTVAIGPRSTIYAPAAKLGLIAVWDDGDPLLREPLAPHVHARDAALQRQALTGAAIVFASHSRSTAVQRLEEIGYLDVLDVPRGERPSVVPADLVPGQEGRIPSVAYGAIRRGLADGPVLVQVAKPGYATRMVCSGCGAPVRCEYCTGPIRPRARRDSRAGAGPECSWCGRSAGGHRCEVCNSTEIREAGSGSGKTAGELGRAFPGTAVAIADGEHELLEIDDRPRLVVATPGAAPVAKGGYRAVVLLDGASSLLGERLSVVEDTVRHWRAALALGASNAACVVTGATAELATALNRPTTAGFAAAELAQRRELGFPPAARVASIYGGDAEVARAVEALNGVPGVDTLGTVSVKGPQGQDEVRTIVRFAYGSGPEAASRLRAEILRAATGRRKGSGRLRVKMDDLEPFEGVMPQ